MIKRIAILTLLILSVLVILSCGTRHHVELKEEFHGLGFNFGEVITHGLVIYGVARGPVAVYPMQRIEYSSRLYNHLSKDIKNVQLPHMISPMELIDHLGKEAYKDFMNEFDMTGHPTGLAPVTLQDSIIDAAYALFAEIEYQRDWKGVDETYTTNEKGESIIEIEEYHIYQLTMDFRIYERASGTYVYGLKIFDEAQASNTRTKSAGCIEGLIDEMLHSALGGKPPEIKQREVVDAIYKEFTRRLQMKLAESRPLNPTSNTP